MRWAACPGFPDYEISDAGLIRRCVKSATAYRPFPIGVPLKGRRDERGRVRYQIVDEHGNRRVLFASRLVAIAFVPGDHSLLVCHRNGDNGDNRAVNLYWGTHADNMRDRDAHGNTPRGERAAHAKVSDDDVRQIRALSITTTRSALAARFGLTPSNISKIVLRQSWQHI